MCLHVTTAFWPRAFVDILRKKTGDLQSWTCGRCVCGRKVVFDLYCTVLGIIERKCSAKVGLSAVIQELLNCAGRNCDGIMSEEEEETPSPPC